MLMAATFTQLQKLALSFPEAAEEPHFEKTSFRVKKKIFVSYDARTNQACLKLSETDQDVFGTIAKGAIFPVPNKWGRRGWTLVQLELVDESILTDALTTAYCHVAPKALASLVRSPELNG